MVSARRRAAERRDVRRAVLRQRRLAWLGLGLVLALALLLAGVLMGPGAAFAVDHDQDSPNLSGVSDADTDEYGNNRAMCWRTEDRGGGFGDETGADMATRWDLEQLGLKRPFFRKSPNFWSRADLLDQRFYAFEQFRKTESDGAKNPRFDHQFETDNPDAEYTAWVRFKKARDTSNKDTRFDSISVRWVDSTNTTGGFQTDPSAVLRQQAAGDAAVTAGTTSQTKGYRQHFTNPQLSNTTGFVTGSASCNPITGQCNIDIDGETETAFESSDEQEVTWESNVDGSANYGGQEVGPEVSSNTVTSGAAGDWSYIAAQDADVFDPDSQQGEERLRLGDYPDTEQDRIRVVIDLDGKHRADQWVNYTLNSLTAADTLEPLFGGGHVMVDRNSSGQIETFRQSRLLTSYVDEHQIETTTDSSDDSYVTGVELVADSDGESVIEWPAYLTDVAWYLFAVAPQGFTKEHSADDRDAKALVRGGFLKGQAIVPEVGQSSQGPKTGLLPFETKALSGTDGTGGSLVDQPGAYLLDARYLLKRGVSIPNDRNQGSNGFSANQTFEFDIIENEMFSDYGVDQSEAGLYYRMGIPEEKEEQEKALTAWPNEALNPNLPYLLVLTFYEGELGPRYEVGHRIDKLVSTSTRQGRGRTEWKTVEVEEEVGYGSSFKYRRVVCRVLVYPLGVQPGESWWSKVIGGVGASLGTLGDRVGGWVDGLKSWFSNWWKGLFVQVGESVGASACAGMQQVDGIAGQGPEDADLVLTAAEESELEAKELCDEQTTPAVPVCSQVASAVQGERCLQLPKLAIQLDHVASEQIVTETDRWQRLEAVYANVEANLRALAGAQRGRPGITRANREALDVASQSNPYRLPTGDGAHPVTLSEVTLSWDGRMPDSVTGFRVYVVPDRKSTGGERYQREYSFNLNRWYGYTFEEEEGIGLNVSYQGETRSIKFGGLRDPWDGQQLSPKFNSYLKTSVDENALADHVRYQNRVTEDWPLIDGFVYHLSVAPYVGFPGTRSYQEGLRSTPVLLEGGRKMTCLDPDFHDDTEISDGESVIYDFYDCGGSGLTYSDFVGFAGAGVFTMLPDLFSNVWRLHGTDVCGSIMTIVPAGLTWDNPGVQLAWSLVWAVSTLAIVLLSAWQGLKMVIEHHTEPNGGSAYALRIFVPRMLLALVFASLSLLFCSVVLTLASTLTCWVSQATGVTLWGFVGASLAAIFSSWTTYLFAGGATVAGAGAAALGAFSAITATVGTGGTLAIGVGIGVLVVLLGLFLFIVILFALVVWQMVVRVALLAVLVALSPMAMMLYASESTSHWTKTWMRLFAGATVQQVVVIIVIFIGISIMRDSTIGGGGLREGGIDMVIGSFLVGLMTLYLAYKVPGLINPDGARMFDGFGAMLKMPFQAAAVLVGGVVGGVAGALAAGGGTTPGVTPTPGGTPTPGATPTPGDTSASVESSWPSSIRPDVSPSSGSPSGVSSPAGDSYDATTAGGRASSSAGDSANSLPGASANSPPDGPPGQVVSLPNDPGAGSPGRATSSPSSGESGDGPGQVVSGPDDAPVGQAGGFSGGVPEEPPGQVIARPVDSGEAAPSGGGGGGGNSRWQNFKDGMFRGVRMAQRGNRSVDDLTGGRWINSRTRLNINENDGEDDRDDARRSRRERQQNEERHGEDQGNE